LSKIKWCYVPLRRWEIHLVFGKVFGGVIGKGKARQAFVKDKGRITP